MVNDLFFFNMLTHIHIQELPNGISFPMCLVKGGTFLMGSEAPEAWDREKPIHQVQLDNFYIGQFPVTQAVWKAIMGANNNPSYFKGDQRPVETVSWEDCRKFILKLNQEVKDSLFPGYAYRLPTEAEWEYAARGGQLSKGYSYAGSNKLKEVGWYAENTDGETKHVGQLQPNELGLYDMSGNIFEWCWNRYVGYQQNTSEFLMKNHGGLEMSDWRVLRGGYWSITSLNCRSTYRDKGRLDYQDNHLGFRLVLSPSKI